MTIVAVVEVEEEEDKEEEEEEEDLEEEEEEEYTDASFDESRGYHLSGNGQAAREEERSSDVTTHDGSEGLL